MSLDVLTAIWRDPPCKGGDLLCLLAIADNADDEGYAWPSIKTIAKKAAMGERGAQKCVQKLAGMGLISIKTGGGRNKTNAYQITTNGIGGGQKHQNPEQNTPNPGSPFKDVNPEQSDINPEPAFAKPRTPVHPNSQEPSKEPSYVSEFEIWWGEVPRKGDKKDALKAYKAARKKTDAQTLLAGIKGYAQSVKGTEERFIKLPAGWLRLERWEMHAAKSTPEWSPEDRLNFYADWVNGEKGIPTSTIKPGLARELLANGLVTPQRLKERGIAA